MATSAINHALLKLRCVQAQWIQTVCMYFHLPASTFAPAPHIYGLCVAHWPQPVLFHLPGRLCSLFVNVTPELHTKLSSEWNLTTMTHLKFPTSWEWSSSPQWDPSFFKLQDTACAVFKDTEPLWGPCPSRMVGALREGTISHSFRW